MFALALVVLFCSLVAVSLAGFEGKSSAQLAAAVARFNSGKSNFDFQSLPLLDSAIDTDVTFLFELRKAGSPVRLGRGGFFKVGRYPVPFIAAAQRNGPLLSLVSGKLGNNARNTLNSGVGDFFFSAILGTFVYNETNVDANGFTAGTDTVLSAHKFGDAAGRANWTLTRSSTAIDGGGMRYSVVSSRSFGSMSYRRESSVSTTPVNVTLITASNTSVFSVNAPDTLSSVFSVAGLNLTAGKSVGLVMFVKGSGLGSDSDDAATANVAETDETEVGASSGKNPRPKAVISKDILCNFDDGSSSTGTVFLGSFVRAKANIPIANESDIDASAMTNAGLPDLDGKAAGARFVTVSVSCVPASGTPSLSGLSFFHSVQIPLTGAVTVNLTEAVNRRLDQLKEDSNVDLSRVLTSFPAQIDLNSTKEVGHLLQFGLNNGKGGKFSGKKFKVPPRGAFFRFGRVPFPYLAAGIKTPDDNDPNTPAAKWLFAGFLGLFKLTTTAALDADADFSLDNLTSDTSSFQTLKGAAGKDATVAWGISRSETNVSADGTNPAYVLHTTQVSRNYSSVSFVLEGQIGTTAAVRDSNATSSGKHVKVAIAPNTFETLISVGFTTPLASATQYPGFIMAIRSNVFKDDSDPSEITMDQSSDGSSTTVGQVTDDDGNTAAGFNFNNQLTCFYANGSSSLDGFVLIDRVSRQLNAKVTDADIRASAADTSFEGGIGPSGKGGFFAVLVVCPGDMSQVSSISWDPSMDSPDPTVDTSSEALAEDDSTAAPSPSGGNKSSAGVSVVPSLSSSVMAMAATLVLVLTNLL